MHKTFHLDLGCGSHARNPYGRDFLVGCDFAELEQTHPVENFKFTEVDLSKNKLPFDDSSFDSISAFDFIEHVPRLAYASDGKIYFPFMSLMSEIHRVLKKDGIFLASTPAYPRAEAFQDPTHVNIITEKTHEYFCGDSPYAKRYGFDGQFELIRVQWEPQKNAQQYSSSKIRKWIRRNVEFRIFKGGFSHLTWELKALKV